MSAVPGAQAGSKRKPSARANAQRSRIIDAAEKCFVDSGFHAASIADIADTAGMSPGLIYRYFENKNAIVRAIIERCLEEDAGKSIQRLESPEDVLRAMFDIFDRWRFKDSVDRKSAVLLLETTAESTRNAEMAAVVTNASDVMRKRFEELIERSAKSQGAVPNAAASSGRAMMLQCLIYGLAVQAIRQTEFDQAAFAVALKDVVDALIRV